jgi:hypothetical protein
VTEIQQTSGADVAVLVERAIIHGDLSGLGPKERTAYYVRVCESVGLNPLTKPFEYLRLNGKETLYATRACTDQLRQLHGVSVRIVSREHQEGVYVVTAAATDKTGRTDESTGAVPVGNTKGEALANAMMKAETKAKRRVTLSICGLGFLDESELDTIPSTRMQRIEPIEDPQTIEAAVRALEPPKAAPTTWAATALAELSAMDSEDTLRDWATDAKARVSALEKREKVQVWAAIQSAARKCGIEDVSGWWNQVAAQAAE